MVKIAIIGKMCSGKTTITDYLITLNSQFKKLSFADKVKEIAIDLFEMTKKDRYLLQSIGTKMREIKSTVWADYTVKQSQNYQFVLIDDLRYQNEFKCLKQENFKFIKLNISSELQIERLKKTYPDSWESHIENLQHQSETEIDTLNNDLFDLVIDVDKDEQQIFTMIDKFFKNLI